MPTLAQVCIFCGGRPLTKEHILSKWLGPLIRTNTPNYKSVKTFIGRSGVEFTPRTRSGHLSSRRVRCVCGGCNNGWMSGVVSAAQPIVNALMKGNSSRLTTDEQSKLAAWIATAVIVSEFENPNDVTIPEHHRNWLRETHTAPPDWKIWIGDYKREKWLPQWIHHSFSVTGPDEPPPEKGAEGPQNTQTTTYVVGRLYIHALSSTASGGPLDWQFRGRDGEIMRQIWPATGYSVLWPPPTMNDTDADRIAGALMQLSLRILGLPPTQQLVPHL